MGKNISSTVETRNRERKRKREWKRDWVSKCVRLGGVRETQRQQGRELGETKETEIDKDRQYMSVSQRE